MLYFAYGSNLNKNAMARRCPDAEPLFSFDLPNWQLVFRGVADAVEMPGGTLQGGVWKITDDCERSLDRYEGVAGGLYSKVYLPVNGPGAEREMLIYVMNSTGIMPPSQGYLETIVQGYRDFKLPFRMLREAVKHSWDNKNKTMAERARYHRGGYAPFALPGLVPVKTDKPAPKPAPARNDDRVAIGALMPDGSRLHTWNERLRVSGGIPIYGSRKQHHKTGKAATGPKAAIKRSVRK